MGGPRPRASRAVALVVAHRVHDLDLLRLAGANKLFDLRRVTVNWKRYSTTVGAADSREDRLSWTLHPSREEDACTDCDCTARIDRCIFFNPYTTT
jgi:hypothetical protein